MKKDRTGKDFAVRGADGRLLIRPRSRMSMDMITLASMGKGGVYVLSPATGMQPGSHLIRLPVEARLKNQGRDEHKDTASLYMQ